MSKLKRIFSILLIALFSISISVPQSYAGKSAVAKQISKKAAKQAAKKAAKGTLKSMAGNTADTKIIRQLQRDAVREATAKSMKKAGIKSFEGLSCKRYSRIKPNSKQFLPVKNQTQSRAINSKYQQMLHSEAASSSKALKRTLKVSTQRASASTVPSSLSKRIAKSKLGAEQQRILAKEPIVLTEREMSAVFSDQSSPDKVIRSLIEIKTGDKKNFQEFFIRLAKGNPEQASILLNNKEIRTYVDRSIRRSGEGGVHEWLMTKNFKDFLTNPKWGNDGSYLALATTRLVQKTANVTFKSGGRHGALNSGRFHRGLANAIDKSNNAYEVLINVRRYARQNLSPEAYDEFKIILREVLA